MLVIPALTIMRGHAVVVPDGRIGDARIVSQNPPELVRGFLDRGATWLHIEDMDGGFSGGPRNITVLSDLRSLPGIKIQYGGGVANRGHIERLLASGVDRVVISADHLVDEEHNRALFDSYGEQLGVEFAMRAGMIGGANPLGGEPRAGIDRAAEIAELGARCFIATDIATRGALSGPNLPMAATWIQNFGNKVIIQGGVAQEKDLQILSETGCAAVIVGRALVDGSLGSIRLGD